MLRMVPDKLRVRQRFGKYIIEKRIGEGGFATVYQASDTIEGVRVALKIPHSHLMNEATLAGFRQEARFAAKLDHPNILPLKYADFIEGKFVIITALSESTLEDRLQRRLALRTAFDFAGQMLNAAAYAHQHKIVHCDIKPDNLLIFADNRLVLTDFGIAKVAYRTLKGSGGGTIGYLAPEQAMGHPSFQSDVFSLGVVMYRMFSGTLPEWPYEWPMAGHARLRERVSEPLIELLQQATAVNVKRRYRDGVQMLAAFNRIKRPLLSTAPKSIKRTTPSKANNWQSLRKREFQKQFGETLCTHSSCTKCNGPVAEAMFGCPWCGASREKHLGKTSFPQQCPRCWRGMKLDWPYCPWCYGSRFEVQTTREFEDKRYTARCTGQRCTRKLLMPFMRYCPWCRIRSRRKWKIEGVTQSCGQCGWGIVPHFWNYCPWCVARIEDTR